MYNPYKCNSQNTTTLHTIFVLFTNKFVFRQTIHPIWAYMLRNTTLHYDIYYNTYSCIYKYKIMMKVYVFIGYKNANIVQFLIVLTSFQMPFSGTSLKLYSF